MLRLRYYRAGEVIDMFTNLTNLTRKKGASKGRYLERRERRLSGYD